MSKYSLQTECLENIEAYSDEQMASEIAVIESVFDIFDKTLIMMELSNTDVDIPDCSMFMESTFIQEEETTDGGQPAEQQEETTAETTSSDGGEKKADNKPPTEAERKKYNSEHQFRQMNKKGNVENIFISIIAFIPRLLGFLIQCVVKLFKKITNKKSDDDIKKASQDAQELTEEEIEETSNETDAELPEDPVDQDQPQAQPQGQLPMNQAQPAAQPQQPQQQPAPVQNDTQNAAANTASAPAAPAPAANMNDNVGKMDSKSKMWSWFDEQKVLEAINNLSQIMGSLDLTNVDTVTAFGNEIVKGKNQLNAALSQRVAVNGDVLISSKNNITKQLNGLADAAKRTSDSIENFRKNRENISRALRNGKIVKETRNAVNSLKDYAKDFSKKSAKIIKAYVKAAKQADKIIAKASRKNGGAVTQPQEGGNPNGGQEQNNTANT